MGEQEYKFSIKGDSFNITGLKTPTISTSSSEDEIDGFIIEKTFLIMQVINVVDTLFLKYIEKRISDEWNTSDLKDIRAWIQSWQKSVQKACFIYT